MPFAALRFTRLVSILVSNWMHLEELEYDVAVLLPRCFNPSF